MKIGNISGKDQEIHYTDRTEIIKHRHEHEVDMKNINRPELERIKNVFVVIPEEKKQAKPAEAQPPVQSEAVRQKQQEGK